MEKLYDKTGAVFEFDHEIEGTAYVRPMIKVVDYDEGDYLGEDPADYLISRPRAELFEAPPVEALDADISAKREELRALQDKIAKETRDAESATWRTKLDLETAQRQLKEWMAKHKVMIDLGKLLEGETLYPLTVQESSDHGDPDVPYIPEPRNARYLSLSDGDWETGKAWVCRRYSSDHCGRPFRFYDTEEDRDAAIQDAFDRTCDAFRKSPDFSGEGRTYSTRLDFGRLTRWVEAHPALAIPDDILAMKTADDAEKFKQRKAKLAADLAALEEPTP